MSRTYPLMSITADFTQGPPFIPGNSGVQLLPATAAGNNPACRGWSTTRGRQYELDVVQAGTASLDVVDPAEWLNPVNTASPWNSGGNSLLPYRCTQIAAWWNGATRNTAGNLLNSTNIITGSTTAVYDPSFEAGGLGGWFGIAGAPTLVSSTAQHFDGARSVSVTYNGGSDVAAVALPATVPGQVWTFSLYVFVAASHTVTASLYNFPLGAPLASATSSTTGAWQRLTLTATPTTRYAIVQLTVSGTTPTTVFIDAMQLEFAPSASAFTTAGPTFYEVFTGYVERYPQQWDSQGFRGLRPLEAVDALSVLSRTTISQSYAATVLADAPAVFAPYNDDAFPQTVRRPTGGQQMVPYQYLGTNSPSINFAGDSFLDGSKAVAISQQNTNPVNPVTDATQVTYLGTLGGSLQFSAQSFSLEFWVRWVAGQFSIGAGTMQPGETTLSVTGPTRKFHFQTFSNWLTALWFDNTQPSGLNQINQTIRIGGNKVFADGAWHHCTLNLTGGNAWNATVDGAVTTGVAITATPASAIDNVYALATSAFGDPLAAISVANFCLYQTALSATQINSHYQRGIGYLGEKSGTRALRLLTKYWSTNVVTDTGVTSMATDFSYSGRSMLDVLQEIADTENGLVWADAAGVVHQDSRETRYTAVTSTTSQFTFGENSGAGELPYEELEYDFDPTYVYSEADLTAGGSGNQLAPVVNATSQTAYGQRILSKTLQMQNDWDVNQAGLFYVQRYAKPAGATGTGVPPRVSKMTLNPAANPALFTAVLSMDIGTRITVKRRTSAVTISGDYYVEQINHDASGDASSWTTDLQLSPVFVSQPWILGDAVKGVLGSTTVCVY